MNHETLSYLAKATGVPCHKYPNVTARALIQLAVVTDKQLLDRGCDLETASLLLNVSPLDSVEAPETTTPGAFSRTEIHKMRKHELIALCDLEGLTTAGTASDLKDLIFAHLNI